MCIVRSCCCGCNLKQATIGIIGYDFASFLVYLGLAIVIAYVLGNDDINPDNLDSFKTLQWLQCALPLLRFLAGLVLMICSYPIFMRFFLFVWRIIFSTANALIFMIVLGQEFEMGSLITLLSFIGLETYLGWMLYSFWKVKNDYIKQGETVAPDNENDMVIVPGGDDSKYTYTPTPAQQIHTEPIGAYDNRNYSSDEKSSSLDPMPARDEAKSAIAMYRQVEMSIMDDSFEQMTKK